MGMGRPDANMPHRLRASSFLNAVPGLSEQFKEVPPEWWIEGNSGQIECPCGEFCLYVPRARFLGCPGCGRLYLLTRTRLLAAQGMTDREWDEYQAEVAA